MNETMLTAIERTLQQGLAPGGFTVELQYELDDDGDNGYYLVWIPGYHDSRAIADSLSGALDKFGQLCVKHDN